MDYPTLSALNPHLPPDTVRDLERRGLLQYDGHTRRYDLHPVVRGIAAGGLRPEERDAYGQRVVDHFSAQAHSPYNEAETLDDVRDGLHIIRTLLKMGRYQQACDAYRGDLASALLFNLEANAEILSLLRPFFAQGWAVLPKCVSTKQAACISQTSPPSPWRKSTSRETPRLRSVPPSRSTYEAADWTAVCIIMINISETLRDQNRLAQEDRCLDANLDSRHPERRQEKIILRPAYRFQQLAQIGQWADAKAIWDLLDPMGRNWSRASYRPGDAESDVRSVPLLAGRFERRAPRRGGTTVPRTGKNRGIVRDLHGLRGEWRLERGEWALAAESLREAVSMARAVGQTNGQRRPNSPSPGSTLVNSTIHAARPSNSPSIGGRPTAPLRTFGLPSATASRRRSTRWQPTSGLGRMASLMSTATN